MTFGLNFVSLVAKNLPLQLLLLMELSGDTSIANFWCSKFEQLLNTSCTHDAGLLLHELDHLITSDNVRDFSRSYA